jgi:hypothetical protein
MKLIFSVVFGILALAVIWYYVPEPTRNKLVNFTGKVIQHDPKELPELAKRGFFPKDPEEKREILIGQIKTNLERIKTGLPAQTGTEVPKSIAEAERLLVELKAANQEKTIATGVLDRALEAILPSKISECTPSKSE